jgi:CheY-like chemotaxis protein
MSERKTILIVDDDPGARHLLQFVLSKTGSRILTAANGTQAAQIAGREKIDLLVTDLMMAGMDGFQLAQVLYQLPGCDRLPVIVLSARWQVDYREDLPHNDRVALMPKPFSPIELTAKVNQFLES